MINSDVSALWGWGGAVFMENWVGVLNIQGHQEKIRIEIC